jgi:hypothetical protein
VIREIGVRKLPNFLMIIKKQHTTQYSKIHTTPNSSISSVGSIPDQEHDKSIFLNEKEDS